MIRGNSKVPSADWLALNRQDISNMPFFFFERSWSVQEEQESFEKGVGGTFLTVSSYSCVLLRLCSRSGSHETFSKAAVAGLIISSPRLSSADGTTERRGRETRSITIVILPCSCSRIENLLLCENSCLVAQNVIACWDGDCSLPATDTSKPVAVLQGNGTSASPKDGEKQRHAVLKRRSRWKRRRVFGSHSCLATIRTWDHQNPNFLIAGRP